MVWAILAVYVVLALVAALNLALMRRPPASGTAWNPAIAIPARNEAQNLREMIPSLASQGATVYVYDDESTDGTAEVAASLGAKVLLGGPLPPGWLGKNWACHSLAKAVAEDHPGEWTVFLDADVRPGPDFVRRLGFLATRRGAPDVLTGFPKMLPGDGLEPAYLGWVPWVLLATNPFGLVARTGKGHNMFTNGQIVAWRTATYLRILPHEANRAEVLEDVKIGRTLARLGERVEVANLAGILAVRMYATLPDAIAGMSKNSASIAGPGWGSALVATGLLIAAWGWLLAGRLWPLALLLLLLSNFLTGRVVRYPVWTMPLLPLTLSAAAWTVLRSWRLRRQGRLEWKGRTIV